MVSGADNEYDYDPGEYPPFAVTVDIAIFTIRDEALHLLLIQRGGEPFRGAWALPGGFVRPDEDLDQAAARELAEETGVRAGSWHLEQLGSYGAPERDPRMRVVTVAYWAICAELPALRDGGDAVAVRLTPVEAIESGAVRLAFDHERIVRDAVERTRSKLEYTALAAKFCPPQFTISQLRRVYEAVWNTRLDPGNFQRNVQESRAFEKRAEASSASVSGRGRPASLWSVRESADVDSPPALPMEPPAALRMEAPTVVRMESPAARAPELSADMPLEEPAFMSLEESAFIPLEPSAAMLLERPPARRRRATKLKARASRAGAEADTGPDTPPPKKKQS